METMDAVRCDAQHASNTTNDPELDYILRFLSNEDQDADGASQRRYTRCAYRVRATLIMTDPMGHEHRHPIFTRDANAWGVGFVTRAPLVGGVNAKVQIAGADGQQMLAKGSIVRCRNVMGAWWEGGVMFEQEQLMLSPAAIDGAIETARPPGLCVG